MLAFLEGEKDLPLTEHKKAIVTLAVGDDYINLWRTLCASNWVWYAQACGYDIIVITERLDLSERGHRQNPSWHKLLVFSQSWASKYERIVWIDADVLISTSALDIVTYAPDPKKIAICESSAQFSAAEFHIYKERLHGLIVHPSKAERFLFECSRANYEREGLVSDNPVEFNAGVFVASPEHHADFLRNVYNKYDEQTRQYEQIPLSYEITKADLAQPISSRFNWCLQPVVMLSHYQEMGTVPADQIIRFLRNELAKAYFLHFAGCGEMLKLLAEWHGQMKAHPLGI